MPQSAIVVAKDATTTIDLFPVHLPERKITSSSPSVFIAVASLLFNKWFGRAHSYDVQVQKYSSLASADHCDFRLSLMATCVFHKAHVHVLMVNLSDMF